MSCICPPGTKSSQSYSYSGLTLASTVVFPVLDEKSYIRGLTVLVDEYPAYGGKRFSYDIAYAYERLYEVGVAAFVDANDFVLPEIELQWNRNYLYLPEGFTQIHLWLFPSVLVTVTLDVWDCPEEEVPPPPPPGGEDPGSGGNDTNTGGGGNDTNTGGGSPGGGG